MQIRKGQKVVKNRHKLSGVKVKKADESIEILGVVISGSRMNRVLSKMRISRKEMLHVATVNPEYIMEARSNPKFKSILSQCLTVADGHGIIWGNKILNPKFSNSQMGSIDRISGTELVGEILTHAHQKGEKVFLLGAADGVAEKAASEMSTKYPGLQMYWYEGARTVRLEKDEEASMTIAKINSISPDYLLVAYGSPWQDTWIEENRPYLRVRVAMGVGGVFDEWAGVVKVCPDWIDRLGMKWVWRVVHEPWRWRRILRVWQFGFLVIWLRLKEII